MYYWIHCRNFDNSIGVWLDGIITHPRAIRVKEGSVLQQLVWSYDQALADAIHEYLGKTPAQTYLEYEIKTKLFLLELEKDRGRVTQEEYEREKRIITAWGDSQMEKVLEEGKTVADLEREDRERQVQAILNSDRAAEKKRCAEFLEQLRKRKSGEIPPPQYDENDNSPGARLRRELEQARAKQAKSEEETYQFWKKIYGLPDDFKYKETKLVSSPPKPSSPKEDEEFNEYLQSMWAKLSQEYQEAQEQGRPINFARSDRNALSLDSIYCFLDKYLYIFKIKLFYSTRRVARKLKYKLFLWLARYKEPVLHLAPASSLPSQPQSYLSVPKSYPNFEIE
jgi:flagellar hook-basal body complex protein FliE